MAKNYTFKEAVAIIAAGKDLEAIADIGRRYPILAHKIAVIATKASEEFVDLMSYMPDYLTANKINTAIKASITESGSDEGNTEDGNVETTEVETEDATEATIQWNENMSAKQLWDILGKAGKRKLAKSTRKADLIEACKQAFGTTTTEAEAKAEDTEAETEANPYEGKSVMELFKECKARKIKADPKKPAKYYIDLLIKDDAAKAEAAEAESDEEDWDDEEENEKAAPKASTKKVEVESEDDDDDWDI